MKGNRDSVIRLSFFTGLLSTVLVSGLTTGIARPAGSGTTAPGKAVSVAITRPAEAGWAGGSASAPDEQKFLGLVNQERQARGLPPLAFDPLLSEVARAHSREMASRGYFAHESPTPGRRTPMERYLSAFAKTPQYLLVGENLLYCSVRGAERGHKSLMASDKHRKNLLDERYEAVGIGTYTSADGEYWVTQMFLKRRD